MPDNETKTPSCLHCGTELTPVRIGLAPDDDGWKCEACGRVFDTNVVLVSVGVFSEQVAEEGE